MEDTPFWSKNVSLLLYPEILPTSSMTSNQKWNATSRLILLISIVLTILRSSLDSLVIGAVLLGLIALAHPYFISKENKPDDSTLDTPFILPSKPLSSPTSIKKAPPTVSLLKLQNKPTKNNPFMNINTLQLGQPERFHDDLDVVDSMLVNKGGSSNSDTTDTSKEIDAHFYQDLFRDVSDVYGKVHSQRQFYTMPVTTIPNDQDKFAHWLYG